ncbi:hypothetical protein HDK90DRAFT_468528 [Phyllosticta capitalensis]|uniref:F-box domain-containing protein n=1 Tax=Phyllosticta capitalensis TaxID=121624 RepID=A0ABR1YGR2_9PEZI
MFSALSSSIQGTLQRFHRMMEHALDEALDAADEALRPPQGRGGDDASSSSSAAATASASTAGHQNPNPARAADFTPLVGDVHAVKRALMRPPCSLPIELVISILDYAEYWPVLARAERHDRVRYTAATTPGNSVADLYLASPPLPVPEGEDGELVRATPREVRFCIRSRDQGWVSQDRRGLAIGCRSVHPYEHSYSWFDASIIRPTSSIGPSTAIPPALPHLDYDTNPVAKPADAVQQFASASLRFVPRTLAKQRENEETGLLEEVHETEEVGLWKLQSNRVAERGYRVHRILWKEGDGGDADGFVEALQAGDKVGVWARAMFPGWANEVDGMAIEVRGSVI